MAAGMGGSRNNIQRIFCLVRPDPPVVVCRNTSRQGSPDDVIFVPAWYGTSSAASGDAKHDQACAGRHTLQKDGSPLQLDPPLSKAQCLVGSMSTGCRHLGRGGGLFC